MGNVGAAPRTQLINPARLPIPIVPTGHVLPRAGELSPREMAYDTDLVFDDVGIELG